MTTGSFADVESSIPVGLTIGAYRVARPHRQHWSWRHPFARRRA